MIINDAIPSKELYLKVRAGFVFQGTSLGAWCQQRGLDRTNVRAALIGAWDGPKGRKVRRRAVRDSGISRLLSAEA